MRESVLLILLLVVALTRETAASEVALDRELSFEEQLSITVARTSVILVGRLVAGYDTLVANNPSVGRFSVLTFEPVRILKGRSPGTRFRFVAWSEAQAFSSEERPGQRGISWSNANGPLQILCLEDIRAGGLANQSSVFGAAQRVSRWATSLSGRRWLAQPGLRDWSAIDEGKFRRIIARQTLEQMSGNATRIVLARAPVQPFPGNHAWTVERTLKGSARSKALVRTLVPDSKDDGMRAFLFLTWSRDAYEPEPPGGGIVRVVGDRVPAWGITVDEAIARIESVVR